MTKLTWASVALNLAFVIVGIVYYLNPAQPCQIAIKSEPLPACTNHIKQLTGKAWDDCIAKLQRNPNFNFQ